MFAAVRFVRDWKGELDPRARHVAITLAAFMGRDGTGTASLRQLAASTGYHTHTVELAIGRLEAAGIIKATHAKGRTGRYIFPVADALELSPTARARRAQLNPVDKARTARVDAATARARRAQLGVVTTGESDPRGTFLPGSGWIPEYRPREAL